MLNKWLFYQAERELNLAKSSKRALTPHIRASISENMIFLV